MTQKIKLDDLDKEVEEIKAKHKVNSEKEKRINKIIREQEAKLQELKIQEEKIVKKAKKQSKFMYAFVFGVIGLAVLMPIWKKDPVNFWFYIIVAVCTAGIVAIKGSI